MAAPYAPIPNNMTASSVLGTPTGASVLTANEQITISGIVPAIPTRDILDVTRTAYAAGTLKIATFAISGTVDTTVAYDFNIQPEGNTYDTSSQVTYTVFAAAATATSLATALSVAINADPNRIVNSVDGGAGTITLTQISLTTGDFQMPDSPQSITTVFTATTPYVRPSGTLTDIAQYTSASVTGTTFDKYVISYLKPTVINGEGKTQYIASCVVVFANTAAAAITSATVALTTLYSYIIQATSTTTGVTLNSQKGIIDSFTSTGAAATPYVFTLTNSTITTSSFVKCWVVGGTWTTGMPVVSPAASGSGSVVIHVVNAGTAALNGTVDIAFEVIQ